MRVGVDVLLPHCVIAWWWQTSSGDDVAEALTGTIFDMGKWFSGDAVKSVTQRRSSWGQSQLSMSSPLEAVGVRRGNLDGVSVRGLGMSESVGRYGQRCVCRANDKQ